MNRLLLIIIYLLTFCIQLYAQSKHEIRAVWLTTNFGLDWPSQTPTNHYDIDAHKKELCSILDKLKEANFNMIFFQTRIRGDVIYPSRIEPWYKYVNPMPTHNPDYDPLAFIIKACHDRGLECHAWFVTYPLGSSLKSGQNIPDKKNTIKKFMGEYYLDPGNPKTTEYLLSLISEIVKNYDIDGLHFDYIRYPDKSLEFPDKETYKKYGYKENLSNWRRENINHFVYQAYDRIKELKPWVQVSSSVLGMYKKIPGNTQAHWTAYENVFQDPVDWLKKGKHDFIVPMMYYTDNLFYPFVNNWVQNCNNRFIVPGIGLYRMDESDKNWDNQTIMDQIKFSRNNQTQGNAYFRAKYLINNKKKILNDIVSGFYNYQAQLPALTWLDSIAPLQANKPDAIGENNLLYISWENNPESKNEDIYYSIYRSETFPVDIEDPVNLIATRIHQSAYTLTFDSSIESGYYYIITASDRYHNESITSKAVYFCTGNFEK